jgi:hypothetical protein
VVLPKSGHMTFIDQPGMFNRAVGEFFTRRSADKVNVWGTGASPAVQGRRRRCAGNWTLGPTCFLKGRGRVLKTIETDPTADYEWSLAPDGSGIALCRYGDAEARVRFIALDDRKNREITVKG